MNEHLEPAAIVNRLKRIEGQVILEGHLQHCILNGIREGNEEEAIKNYLPQSNNFQEFKGGFDYD